MAPQYSKLTLIVTLSRTLCTLPKCCDIIYVVDMAIFVVIKDKEIKL
jgi:hypothetical protein